MSTNNTFDIQPIGQQSYLLMQPEYSTRMALLHTPNGYVLIDPMPGREHLDALSQLVHQQLLPTLENGKLISVINTHAHEDHAGGNSTFVTSDTPLYTPQSSLSDLEITAVRSHSTQDLIVYHSASNHIFVGDLFTTDWHPTFYVGGRKGFVLAMQQIQSLGDENSILVPGHGQPSNKLALARFEQHTLQWIDLISQWQEKGKTAKQIMQVPEVQQHLQGFNLENAKEFVPPKVFKRFIQRTLTLLAQEKRAAKEQHEKENNSPVKGTH